GRAGRPRRVPRAPGRRADRHAAAGDRPRPRGAPAGSRAHRAGRRRDAGQRHGAMILARAAGLGDVHLGYCTNIHAGETWDETFANVDTHVRAVKARVAPDRPFGVGLRLSAAAARGLADAAGLDAFRHYLQAHGLYVFTINGFPYGAFSGGVVKERVYRHDWLEDERLAYSGRLAGLLAALVPD